MSNSNDAMNQIPPYGVVRQVAEAIPSEFHDNIIIVGSLAAAYHFFKDDPDYQIRTKDVDCLVSPRIKAVAAGKAVANRLFAEKWTIRKEGEWSQPGTAETADDKLPVVRLNPPGESEWFIELLTVPESETDLEKSFVRLETEQGHFGLCSFRFLFLAEYEPEKTEFGVYIARPEMMALSNLLHHPQIGSATMSGLIGERKIKRSNKDLGRVLALAYLSEDREEGSTENWTKLWLEALKSRFPTQWPVLTEKVGDGLRELLKVQNETDLEEAHFTCLYGLLIKKQPTLEQLKIVGQRLLEDAIEPLEEQAREQAHLLSQSAQEA